MRVVRIITQKRIDAIYSTWGSLPLSYEIDKFHTWVTRDHLLRRRLVSAAGIGRGDRLLDMACGFGHNVPLILEKAKPSQLTCLDASEAMLKRCRSRAPPGTAFVQSHTSKMPFKNNSFGAIFCTYGFTVFQDAEGAMKEAKRCLKPGGRLAIMDVKPFSGAASILNPLWVFYNKAWLSDIERDIPGLMRKHFTRVKTDEFFPGCAYITVGVKK